MATNENSPASPSSKSSFLPVRGSPRSSVDSGSPFLQNLQQRFRKASNASHTSADVPTNTATAAAQLESTTKSRTEASRRAKKYLLEVVKDDWEYPVQLAAEDDLNKRVMMRRDAASWRRREDGMSDLESEREDRRRRSARPSSAAYQSDPYKFDNPDAVGDFVEEKRRKRRKVMAEECEWNEGMRNWVGQRDAWTGATETKPDDGGRRRKTTARLARLHERNESAGTEDSAPLSAASETSQCGLSSGIESSEDGAVAAAAAVAEEGPWLPIYPPLFDEENILRSRIQPTAYPTIYSKVVVQSLTPNIPIPLTHMTKVLVEGWKGEGNWPPGPAQQVTKEIKTGKKSGAFSRWRHAREEAKESKKERVRKSIGFVKKAVGLEKDDQDVGIDFQEHEETAEEDREASRVY